MPLLQPYQGNLEQYSPTAKSDVDLGGIVNAWMKARALKESGLKKQRDQQILEAVTSGQDIPAATPPEAPEGILAKLGQFATGGMPEIGPSSLEQAMAEAAIKTRFESPTDQLINQGKIADAQMKIYGAGGPAPSLYPGSGAPAATPSAPSGGVSLDTPAPTPRLLQGAPPEATGMARTGIPGVAPTSIEYDQFGRPKKTKIDILGRDKFNVEQKKKRDAQEKETTLLRTQATDILDAIGEIEKNIRYFGAAGAVPAFPGEYNKQNWKANLDMLRGNLVLKIMTQLKRASATGSTGFGQLSEKELQLLKDSATQLREGLSEKDAQKYLNKIKEKAEKILSGNGLSKKPTPTKPGKQSYKSLWE